MVKIKPIVLIITATFLGGCQLWPAYSRPPLDIPANYKQHFHGWKSAEPQEQLTPENWWHAYQDPTLERLLSESLASNQSIHVAAAQYQQAQAFLSASKAPLLPDLVANASASRSRASAGNNKSGTQDTVNNYSGTLSTFWEVDLWGRIRNSIATNQANLEASAADLAAIQLSIQTTLAQQYFQLRVLDSQQDLLNKNVTAFENTLKLVKNRYAVGLVSRADVAQAEARYRTTKAQATNNVVLRAQLEHAIAVLVGKAPADFDLPAMPYSASAPAVFPSIPTSVPSQLLERRPDITAAERRISAANAQIGVAKTAYFPTLAITGTVGTQANSFADLLTVPTRLWALGPSLVSVLFDGGQRKSLTNAAIANYDASVSTYKQTILNAFQEVEDSLVALRLLEEQAIDQELAVQAAREALEKTLNLYKAGNVDYTNLITVQINTLNNETAALNILSRKLSTSVDLIKALGGPAQTSAPI